MVFVQSGTSILEVIAIFLPSKKHSYRITTTVDSMEKTKRESFPLRNHGLPEQQPPGERKSWGDNSQNFDFIVMYVVPYILTTSE